MTSAQVGLGLVAYGLGVGGVVWFARDVAERVRERRGKVEP